jgi:hypothetical protein
VIIGIENSWSTFLPDGLFDASRTASYLHFSFQLPAGLDYRHDRLTGADTVNAWAVPEALNRLIGVFFPAGRIVHHMTALADHLRLTEAAGEQAVFLNLRRNSFDILMFHKGRLRFINSFSFRENEDLVYYVLFVMEQAGIMADHYPVILMGDTHLAHEPIELLGQYLSRPLLMDDDKRLRLSPALAGMSWHRYFTVNHLHLCE